MEHTQKKQIPWWKENNLLSLFATMLVLNILVTSTMLYVGHQIKQEEVATKSSTEQKTLASVHEAQVVSTVSEKNSAVVSIIISKEVPKIEQYYQEINPFGGFLGGGFGGLQVPVYRQNGTERKDIGGGSGFLVSSDGYVVTNRHVVSDDEADYTIFTSDNKSYTAKVIAKDTVYDLAVLKIYGGPFPYLEFGDSSSLALGQTVIAIGNSLSEFRNSISVGVVSGLARNITAGSGRGESEHLDNVIQTDAAINPGNSGGPLLNLHGKVIGINVAVAQGSENIGFALPANAIKNIVESVKRTGKISRPYIGVRYTQNSPEVAKVNNININYGVIIRRGISENEFAVLPGSPADKAGILENDIITHIDGEKLAENRTLQSIIGQKSVGDRIVLTINRKGKIVKLSVVLEVRKD